MEIRNILQIDVEDWFCDLDVEDWNKYESRIIKNTEKILFLLRSTGNKATFFILGYFAEKFPELVRKIRDNGCEVASHGYSHTRIDKQTPEQFKQDIMRSKKIIEEIIKEKIIGYRAPQFTITNKTLWALEILKEAGFEYDSSIFPVKTPLYGILDSPRFPHIRKTIKGEIVEIPLSVYNLPLIKNRIPIAGGFYLRAFPYFFIKHAIKKINDKNKPAVMFIHPWDLDPDKPKIEPKKLYKYYSLDSSDKSLKWFHYYGLKTAEKKFKKLLNDFRFISTKEWIKREYYETGKRS